MTFTHISTAKVKLPTGDRKQHEVPLKNKGKKDLCVLVKGWMRRFVPNIYEINMKIVSLAQRLQNKGRNS